MSEKIIDPKNFILPPFYTCPKCKKQQCFGVLSVYENSYIRRCRECWFTKNFLLPSVTKKIIYLDQFAISNISKLLDPNIDEKRKEKTGSFWLELYKRLDFLKKMQVIICPESESHYNESLLSGSYFKRLRKVYTILSHEVSFKAFSSIQRYQILEHAKNWIIGDTKKELNIIRNHAIYGTVDRWLSRLIIAVQSDREDIDTFSILDSSKKEVNYRFNEVYKKWMVYEDFDFDEHYNFEISTYIKEIQEMHLAYLYNYINASQGNPIDVDILMADSMPMMVEEIRRIFEKNNIDEMQSLHKLSEYFSSASFNLVPYINITSLMFSAIARRASNGQKRTPQASIFTDIRTIAVLLPYCDVVFIDNECASLLNEEPVKSRIPYNTKVFSINSKEKFIEYLDELIRNIPKKHINLVRRVYGESWTKPFIECLQERG
jgi:transcription elongation factor Elf1